MRTFRLAHGKRGVYLVTNAKRPLSEDIRYRQRRYLIMMGIRVAGLVLAVFLFHGAARFIAAAVAIVMPYFAVVFANGGREPDSGRRFEPYDPDSPVRSGLPETPAPAPWDAQAGSAGHTGPGAPGWPDSGDRRSGGEEPISAGDSSLSGREAAADPRSRRHTGSDTA